MTATVHPQQILTGWTIPQLEFEQPIRKYSTSGDILSYKRCKRQYGFFSVRGYTSTSSTYRYFGTLVHDVLDTVLRNYRSSSTLPDLQRIYSLVQVAHDRLIRIGIRPFNPKQQHIAAQLIYRFVWLFGDAFFGNIQETEYRLERTLHTHLGRGYILEGVVDVLSGAISHNLGIVSDASVQDVEIWDYKSGKMPDSGSQQLRDYQYQMHVYAELFYQQTGKYPHRTVLVFVGELAQRHLWNSGRCTVHDFPNLVYPLRPEPEIVQEAIQDFHETVEAIEAERSAPYAEQWQSPPLSQNVDRAVCKACELKYSCGYFCVKHDLSRRLRTEPL